MEINQLRYFKVVAETGKIVQAAEKLFVTSSAISSSISNLEKELGMALFVRKGNRLLLNRQGKILLDYAEHILQYVEDAQADLEESLLEASDHIAVAMTAANIWQDVITEFSLKNPKVCIATHTKSTGKINHSIGLNRRFWFILAAEEEVGEGYGKCSESIFLFEDTPVVMVSPEHPLAQKEIVEPEELAGRTLIWPKASFDAYKKLCKIFKKRELPSPQFSLISQQICVTLIKRNAGIALTTAHTQTSYTEGVCFIPVNAPECTSHYRLYWQKDHTLTPAEKQFIDFVKEFYGR